MTEAHSSANSKQDIATLFGMAGFASLFDLDLPPDLKNPDQYSVVVSQSRLGLPDRDYYLKDDPKLSEIRAKYTRLHRADADTGRNARCTCEGARHHGVRDGGCEVAVADRKAP